MQRTLIQEMAKMLNGNTTYVQNGSMKATNSHIQFSINGLPYQVNSIQIPIDTSLNSFIRNHAHLPGTKFMCLEGGCGACVVTATGKDPVTKEMKSWAVNSCLTPIYACEGLDITTVEGVGNKKDGYNTVQKRLNQFHGTQCGYCSPGMIMNMFSLLQAKGGNVTMADVENSFGGNICRCTGYRPILDAFKSMAEDADPKYKAICDIEEVPKTCPKTGKSCSGNCNGNAQNGIHIRFMDGKEWHKITSVDEMFTILGSIGKKSYMLVAGNTAHGVYRRDPSIEVYIDINEVQELHRHVISENQIVLGGNISLTNAMSILENASSKNQFKYCKEIVKHIDLIANVPVRNSGTLAGNLSIKHAHNEFPSDLFLVLVAVNAEITIGKHDGQKYSTSILDYLKTDMTKSVILCITLKPLDPMQNHFKSYKIMPRAQNAHAYVNAAFCINYTNKKIQKSNNIMVESCNICFGGINPKFIHAKKTEQYLIGKDLHSKDTLSNAIKILQDEIIPDHVLPDASPEYRKQLAISLFYKFILATCPESKLPAELKSGGEILKRPISSGTQAFDTYKEKWPITQPIPKVEGLIQSTGEAQYVNDIPHQPGELWAAFVLATEVHHKIIATDPTEALQIPGVRYFFSAKDIPGNNSFTPTTLMMITEDEEIFCSDTVKYFGQPLGMILADSFDLANKAANLVKVQYLKTNKPIIPTIWDAYEQNATERFFETPAKLEPTAEVTDSDTIVKGRFHIGGQYHFTMETQTTVCIPVEDGLDVYSSAQWVEAAQVAISQSLNIPESSINMQVRRLGGGYGSKLSRSVLIACACALGSKLTNKPVRFVMSIESNMLAVGKRYGLISDYEVHVDNKGKIQKLINDFAQDYGCSKNEDVVYNTLEYSKNCYNNDTWRLTSKAVITDSASNSWCRSPGTTEGIAMTENIMEHISRITGLDPVDVRMANIPDDCKMKSLLPEFLESVDFRKRKEDINQFNLQNRWIKRGIAVVPMHYPQPYFGTMTVFVSIYHTDGTVAITHGGVECGQGMNTKVVQVAARTLDIPMEYIKVKPSLNYINANSVCTGGSMTSEAVCYATIRACETLLERIKPIREEMKGAKWHEITHECQNKQIELTATHYYKSSDLTGYSTWGITCAEVETDILTGNVQLKRVDILEDTGESISPHVDIGQIEGAFVMGIGYWLTESLIYDPKSGELLTNRTWNYKPPGAKDIPIDFRITFLRNSSNPATILRSKATGEPSLCMSIVCIFALRHALDSARKDAGITEKWFNMGTASTPEFIHLTSGTKPEHLVL